MGIETDTNQFKIGNGTSTWNTLPYGGLQGPPGTVPANGMTTDTDQTVTGTKTLQAPLLFDNNATVDLGTIQMVLDATVTQGDVFRLSSTAPIGLASPSVFMNSSQVGYKVPGAQVGSLMVVAGIDAEGFALLGYQAPIPPAYSVTATNTSPVVIKATNSVPPTAWVELGLNVTLAQDISAGSANLAFEGVFVNNTTRTGTVEFGMNVNGTDLFREIKVQIGANYNQTIAMNVPLVSGYNAGDVIKLIARVTDNNNNQFALTMANSVTDIGAMRFYQVGVSGGGDGGDADSVDGYSVAVVPTLPGSPITNTIYFVDGGSEDIADGVVDNGAGVSLTSWYGTEAAYALISPKVAGRIYYRSA